MTEYVSLTLHGNSTYNLSFTLSVPKDWIDSYVQTSTAFSLLILGEDLFEWYDIENFPNDPKLPRPTFQILNKKLTISPTSLVRKIEEGDDHRIIHIHMNEAVHFIASILLNLDEKKTSDTQYHANIISGIVRLSTKEGFTKANSSHPSPNDKVFCMGDSEVKDWQGTVWPQKDVDLAEIAFGADDLELELLSTLEQSGSRRRVSCLQIKENNTQLWALASCGASKFKDTKQEILTAQKVLEDYKNNKLKNSLIKSTKPQVSRQDSKVAVFYLRTESGIQTLMQPTFALHFGENENEDIWAPRWLHDAGDRLIFTDHDLLTLNDDGTFKLHGDLTENSSSGKFPAIHWEANQPINVEKIPDMKCVGVSGIDLQDDYLWQYGKVDAPPPVLQEAMSGWTRFHIPDAGDAKPLPSVNVLHLSFGDNKQDWLLSIGQDVTDLPAKPLLLRLTLTISGSKFIFEVIEGLFSFSSPEIFAWSRRLQKPSAPPNTKGLKEGLRKVRLIFAPLSNPKKNESSFMDGQKENDVRSSCDNLSSICINEISTKQKPEFEMRCSNQAVVTYAPFIEDAIIDFVSAGSANLAQTVDQQTLRTVVERDATHGLVPFEIKQCRLKVDAKNTTLTVAKDNYSELIPNISAAMALAPWVQISDQAKYGGDKKRQLFHRNLVLEHGELATASIDRSVDGQTNALVGSAEEFIQSVRDDYAVAANFKGDGQTAAIVNWLPGVTFNDSESSFDAKIKYPAKTNITDHTDRAPVIECKLTGMPEEIKQELRIPVEHMDNAEHMDWLTCDVRLKKVDESSDKNKLIPNVALSLLTGADKKENKDIFAPGSSRARNGNVPLLFDGADFVSCCGDSRSNSDKISPLSWFVAEEEGGSLSIVDRRSGRQLNLLSVNQAALAIGTGQSVDKDWIVRVTKRGEIHAWSKDKTSNTWPNVAHEAKAIGSANVSQLDEAAISATEKLIAILVADSVAGEVHLLFCSPDDDFEVDSVPLSLLDDDPFNFSKAKHWDILLYDQNSIFLAASVPGSSAFVFRGLRTNGTWTFFRLPLRDADASKPSLNSPAMAVSLTRYRDYAAVATLSEGGKHWSLGEITMDGVVQIDSASLTETKKDSDGTNKNSDSCLSSDICLLDRPNGIDGLPGGCRSLWICVANASGSIDVWLSTNEKELRSIQTELAAKLENNLRQPYYRLEGHFGKINGFTPCLLGAEASGKRSDSHSGLVSCGSDGMARLWDLDAMRLVCSHRDSHWMLDNLGTLRSTAEKTAETGRVVITKVSRPEMLHGEPPKPAQIAISYAPEYASPLVQDKNADTITEIYFSCEGLRLKKSSGDSWVPECVEEEITKDNQNKTALLTSRGYFGVFGFFSRIKGHTDATSYLPRIGGVPVFIHEIIEIKISEKDRKITGMTLNGVLINPLLLDGTCSTNDYNLQGDLPAPIAQSLAEQSLIKIKLTSEERPDLYIESVEGIGNETNKDCAITWNMLAADSVSDSSESGFDGQLESLRFTVSYDKRILLNVSPEKSRVRMLGGSHALSTILDVDKKNIPIYLAGYGGVDSEHQAKLYGFETAWESISIKIFPNHAPLKVKKPEYVFSDVPRKIICMTTSANLGMSDMVTVHEGATGSKVLWFDALTWKQKASFEIINHAVRQASVGRSFVPTLIFLPEKNSRFVFVDIDLDSDLDKAKQGDHLAQIMHDVAITTSCLVSDNRNSYLVTGDEAGEVRIWDALSGRKLHQLSIGSGSVTALTGTTHQRKAYVAAVINGKGYLIEIEQGNVFELPGKVQLETVIDLCSSGSLLVAGAAGLENTDEKKTWKALLWHALPSGRKHVNDPLVILKADDDKCIDSVALGFIGADLACFVAKNKEITFHVCKHDPKDDVLSIQDERSNKLFDKDVLGTKLALKFFSRNSETGNQKTAYHLVAAAPGMNLLSFQFQDLENAKLKITHTDKAPSWSTLSIHIVHAAEQNSGAMTCKVFVGPGQGPVARDSNGGNDKCIRAFNLLDPKQSKVCTVKDVSQQFVPFAFAVGGMWTPHLATVDGTQSTIHLTDLLTGRIRKTFQFKEPKKINRVKFAEVGSDGSIVLVGFEEAAVRTLRMSDWTELESLRINGIIHAATVSHDLVLIASDKGAILWPVGVGSDSEKIMRFGKTKQCDFASFDIFPGNKINAILRFNGDPDCYFYEGIKGGKEFAEKKIGLTDSITPKELVNISGRPHLLTESKEKTQIGFWSLAGSQMFYRWSFETGVFFHSTVLKTKGGIQVLTASADKVDEVDVWPIEGLIQFDETGMSRASSSVDLNLSQGNENLDLNIQARICLDGSVAFSSKSQPMPAALFKQGMYAFLVDPLPQTFAAEGILTLWREVNGELAGNLTQVKKIQGKKIQVAIGDLLDFTTAEFQGVELRSWQIGRGRRQELLLNGMLDLKLEQNQAAAIFFADQLIFPEQQSDITGFLDLKTEDGMFQGPLRCQCSFNATDGLSEIKVLSDGYRTIKMQESESNDLQESETNKTIPWDAAFGEHILNLTTADTSNAASEVFVQLKGEQSTQRIKVFEISSERIPVDTCMDNEALQPFGIAPSNIARLSHLQGMGIRLRFTSISEKTNTFSATKEFKGDGDAATIRAIQPVLFDQSGVRILDAGIKSDRCRQKRKKRLITESILSVARPPELTAEQQYTHCSLINCLASSSAETDQVALFDPHDFSQYSLNRWILVRYAACSTSADSPVLSILEGQKTSARESFYLSSDTINNDQPESIGLDLRRLTHTEARQWSHSSENEYAVQPDTPSPERDLDRIAWREIVVAKQSTQEGAPKDEQLRSVLVQEATAFHRMPRQWFLPQTRTSRLENDKTFHPSELRIRFAPDKPGAMMHHRLQFVSTYQQQTDPDRPKFHVGSSVDFSLREPMQLNLPIGSSVKLMDTKVKYSKNDFSAKISFAWKETLGTIPITAQGNQMIIKQLQSQTSEGVPPEEVRVEIMPESKRCLQLIVQINDQLVNLDENQSLFPVYDNKNGKKMPNFFIVSSLPNLYSGVPLNVAIKINGKKESLTVELKPTLMMKMYNSKELKQIEIESYFEEQEVNEDKNYRLYLFNQEKTLNDQKIEIDQVETVCIGWTGKIYEHDVKAIYGGSSGERKLRPVPYASTVAKCCAVLIVDNKDNNEIMQRNLLFGDAANAGSGKGVLRKGEFAFEVEEQETVETALPDFKQNQNRAGLILVKYFADGQTLRTIYENLKLNDETA